MAEVAYLCCTLTSLFCAVLLLRRYRQNPTRLVLFCGLCFAALALENVVPFVDAIILPNVDLSIVRNGLGLLGPTILLAGIIGESQ
jgi:hypothetical protein